MVFCLTNMYIMYKPIILFYITLFPFQVVCVLLFSIREQLCSALIKMIDKLWYQFQDNYLIFLRRPRITQLI